MFFSAGTSNENNDGSAKKKKPHKSSKSISSNKRQRVFSPSVSSLLNSNEVCVISPYDNTGSGSLSNNSSHFRNNSNNNNNSNSSLNRFPNGDKNLLSSWGFPQKIYDYYVKKGISRFFDWQVECLDKPGVLDGKNLVYSAPTSAGKSMVADVLLYKTLLEKKKKGIIILPYVSITVEKVQSLKSLFRRMGIRIDSFAGSTNPRGGLARVDVAVCTIEKANNMINRLIDEGQLADIGIIIVDELHMLGDTSRGYLIELLLTKLLYLKKNFGLDRLQIVGMSATIPNLPDIAKWLDAELYITEFRPVPLYERLVVDNQILDAKSPDLANPIKKLDLSNLRLKQEEPHLIYSAIETLCDGFSVLVFCSTKALCENVGRLIAEDIYEFGAKKKFPPSKEIDEISAKVLEQLDMERIKALLQSLKRTPAGLDKNLEVVVRYGVAFHHAGLSLEERSLVEMAFREGVIRILCSTTTLSAGVNLPARRVLIYSPFDYRGGLLDVTCYRQMIGRAGRKGIDTIGESMLFCKQKDFNMTLTLVRSDLQPIKSCLAYVNNSDNNSNSSGQSSQNDPISMSDNLKRAVLEVVSNGTAKQFVDIENYIRSTFFCSCNVESITDTIREVIEYLSKQQLIYLTDNCGDDKNSSTNITPFGKAVVSAGISPGSGNFIMSELNKARQNLCLINDLHLIYHVTPIYVSEQLNTIDWNIYLSLWNKIDTNMKKVASMIGVKENYLVSKISTFSIPKANDEVLMIHQRFYASLALYDLVQEVPLLQVASKYRMTKGLIQNLQQQAATFAGMLTTFCNKLGWHSLELLIEQFQPRLSFGVQRELIDLMRLPCITSAIARQLFQKGYDTLVSLIYCKREEIEAVLISSNPFVKDSNQGESSSKSTKESTAPASDPTLTKVYIPNIDKYVSIRKLSSMIIIEARQLVEKDVGQKLNFDNESQASSDTSSQSSSIAADGLALKQTETTNSAVNKLVHDDNNTNSNKNVAVAGISAKSQHYPSTSSTLSSASMNKVGGCSVGAVPSHVSSSCIIENRDMNPESPPTPSSDDPSITKSIPYRTSTPNHKKSKLAESTTKNEDCVVTSHVSIAEDNSISDLIISTDDFSTDLVQLDNNNGSIENDKLQQSLVAVSKCKEEQVQPTATVGKKQSNESLSSFMTFNDSLNDLSWSRIEAEAIVPKLECNKRTDNIEKNRKDMDAVSNRFDESEELMSVDMSAKKLDNSPNNEPNSEGSCSLSSIDLVDLQVCKKTSVKKQNLSNSPVLINSDDSMFSFEVEDQHKQVDNLEEKKKQKRNSDNEMSIQDDNVVSKTEPKEYSDELSDLTCDDIESMIMSKSINKSDKDQSSSTTSSSSNLNDSFLFDVSFGCNVELPEIENDLSVLDSLSIIHVQTGSQCQKLFDEIFVAPSTSSILDSSFTNVAMHFVTQPILKVNKFFRSSKKTSSKSELVDAIKVDKFKYEVVTVYFCRQNHSRVFAVSSIEALTFLQRNLFQRLTSIHPHNSTGPKTFRFVVYDIKNALSVLRHAFNVDARYLVHQISWFDLTVALWLFDPESTSFNVDKLSSTDLVQLSLKFKLVQNYFCKVQTILKSKRYSSEKYEDCCKIGILFNLVGGFLGKLLEKNLFVAYKTIEIPSRLCLFLLESFGVHIDQSYLCEQENRIVSYMEYIEKQIFRQVGSRFNLQSPDQVARVLYKQLNLLSNYYDVKKNGASTSKATSVRVNRRLPKHLGTSKLALFKLQQACGTSTNLPTLIMDWRRLNHSLTNSVRAIRNAIYQDSGNRNNKCPSTPLVYCQCDEWSATGRISMHDPNLINTDKDFEVTTISAKFIEQVAQIDDDFFDSGSFVNKKDDDIAQPSSLVPVTIQIRKSIKAREGNVIVSADYSQLELRILAHFSGDPCLLQTLNDTSTDVFKSIAASWKQIDVSEVTYELRQNAKQICYGMIYGMGNKSLAESLAVSIEEAAEYKQSFLQRYSKIGCFTETVIENCFKNGYVETISHRRRPIVNIESEQSGQQARGKRQAVNTMIQGSAADIIKMSMVAVEKAIVRRSIDAWLLLQLHDELMYEVPIPLSMQFAKILKQQMEKVSKHLKVILPVKVKTGADWSSLKDIEL